MHSGSHHTWFPLPPRATPQREGVCTCVVVHGHGRPAPLSSVHWSLCHSLPDVTTGVAADNTSMHRRRSSRRLFRPWCLPPATAVDLDSSGRRWSSTGVSTNGWAGPFGPSRSGCNVGCVGSLSLGRQREGKVTRRVRSTRERAWPWGRARGRSRRAPATNLSGSPSCRWPRGPVWNPPVRALRSVRLPEENHRWPGYVRGFRVWRNHKRSNWLRGQMWPDSFELGPLETVSILHKLKASTVFFCPCCLVRQQWRRHQFLARGLLINWLFVTERVIGSGTLDKWCPPRVVYYELLRLSAAAPAAAPLPSHRGNMRPLYAAALPPTVLLPLLHAPSSSLSPGSSVCFSPPLSTVLWVRL
jgi:hypothetical protein